MTKFPNSENVVMEGISRDPLKYSHLPRKVLLVPGTRPEDSQSPSNPGAPHGGGILSVLKSPEIFYHI